MQQHDCIANEIKQTTLSTLGTGQSVAPTATVSTCGQPHSGPLWHKQVRVIARDVVVRGASGVVRGASAEGC